MSASTSTPQASTTDEPAPLLTAHAALVFLFAAFFCIVVGGLTFLGGTPAAGALLAGLLGGAASVPVLHKLIG